MKRMVALSTLIFALSGCMAEFEAVDTMTLPELVEHCQQDDVYSCVQLGNEYRQVHEFSNAAKYYVKACEINSSDGCREAARIYMEGGNNFPQSLSKSRQYAEKGCQLRDRVSCALLTRIGQLEGIEAVKGHL